MPKFLRISPVKKLLKKTLQRSQHIIAKTSTKKFYRLYLEGDVGAAPYAIFDNEDKVKF